MAELPRRFGRYEVLALLGQGAMGAVYKARDPAIDRLVAVKTVNKTLSAVSELRQEFLARFSQEARAAGKLSHPNIVSVFDVGVDEASATPYIVMELVSGVPLATVLQENPKLPVGQAIELLEQVGSALAEAHAQGIVHRDIKPGNILLDTRGRAKVSDFGIARLPDSELTQTGVVVGTPGYLAPEVLQGRTADERSDVFALAVVGYQLLTGSKPFPGETRDTVGLQILQHSPPPPSEVRPEVPRAASDAVMRALEKRPEARTPSVEAFLFDLGRSDLRSTRVEPVGPVAGVRPRRLLLGGIVALLLALAGGAWWLASGSNQTQEPTPLATPAHPSAMPAERARPQPTPVLQAPRPELTPRPAAAQDQKEDREPSKHGASRGKGHKKKQDEQ